MNQFIIFILFGLFAIVNGAAFIGCSSNQQSQLADAASAAQNYASNAASYLNSHQSSTPRYVTWFGAFTTARKNTVASHFNSIKGNNFASFTYDCSTCTEATLYAYVDPNQFGTIYLCGAFWRAPVTGTDSKAGTIISMASQFTANGGTNMYVYGQSSCKRLAQDSPDQAISNADNHQYFAENNPPLR